MLNKYTIPQEIPAGEPYDVQGRTVGREAVLRGDLAVQYELRASQIEDVVAKSEQLQRTKKTPEEVNWLARKIGRLKGVVMTDDEMRLVDYAGQKGHMLKEYQEAAVEYSECTINDLDNVRRALVAAYTTGSTRQAELTDVCLDLSAPPILKHAKEKQGGDTWYQWLVYNASDEQLMNFAQWNVDTIHRQQTSKAMRYQVENQRAMYKDNLKAAIEEGWLSSDVRDDLNKIDEITVHIGDIFDTFLQERDGYYTYGTDYIVIKGHEYGLRGYRITGAQYLKEILSLCVPHEFNHALLGSLGPRWMDEALTEHINQALRTGRVHVLRPDERKGDEGTYAQERALLADILELGAENIPVTLATRAYSERGSTACRDELERALDRSWGISRMSGQPSCTRLITRHINTIEAAFISQGLTRRQAQVRALEKTRYALHQNPGTVFGKGYKKPAPLESRFAA